jgi:hypothetical protein
MNQDSASSTSNASNAPLTTNSEASSTVPTVESTDSVPVGMEEMSDEDQLRAFGKQNGCIYGGTLEKVLNPETRPFVSVMGIPKPLQRCEDVFSDDEDDDE